MKLLMILTHPLIMILSFLFILVSGEHMGGFYLLYLLLALPHGGLHALLALLGIGLLLLSWVKYKRASKYLIDPILNVLGTGCLYFSLFIFFVRSYDYNSATFKQSVPLLSLVLFAVLSLCFLSSSIIRYAKVKQDPKHLAF